MNKLSGRILVVDDDKSNRMLMEMGLKRQGHQVCTAENGRFALDILYDQPIDLVLLDIIMPEVNGFQVLAEMKSDPILADIPVVIISAMEHMESVVKCIEMGAEDHLTKPFDPTLLNARINASLQKKRYRDQEYEYLNQVSLITDAAIAFEKKEFSPDILLPITQRIDALGTLARVLQKMAVAVVAREEELERDNQIKAAFIDVISHELRSPFASAAMSVELLERYVDNEMYHELGNQINQISSELNRGRQLIETIISFADQVGNRRKLTPVNTDLGALIEETAVSLQPMADEHHIELIIQIENNLPFVLVDQERIKEALHHLLQNAIKFSPSDSQVKVRCHQEKSRLIVQVKDNGSGIPAEILTEIWEPFGQESGNVQRGVEGLGLGLPLVKSIIRAHRGKVGVTSEPGRGSNFYFALPIPESTL